MAKGITGKEPDPRIVYADIIDHPHWQSPDKPHMSMYDRAAQFSPFAALTGYNDMVNEEARYIDNKIDLDDAELDRLNRKLGLISDAIKHGTIPTIEITYFVPDPLKTGGRYETRMEQVKKIDDIRGIVVLNGTSGNEDQDVEINMRNILEIHGWPVDSMDED